MKKIKYIILYLVPVPQRCLVRSDGVLKARLQLANLHAQLAGVRLLLLLGEYVLLALQAERGGEFVDARLQFLHAFRAQGPFRARQEVRCVPR